ncbi:amidohydrolase [Pradoshia sp.]
MRQLWFGGPIYTMVREMETVEAVLVENGHILDTGNLADLKEEADEWVNLNGAAMYPGFVDSHLHILYQGEKLMRLDLSQAQTAEEMLDMLKQASEKTPEGKWLFGDGWNENQFIDKRIPSIAELDAIHSGPMLLTRVCRHMTLVNTAALKAGGIDEHTIAPHGGEIGRDENGNLNGLLYDQAMNAVNDAQPRLGEEYITYLTEALDRAIRQLQSFGVTGAHTEDMDYFGSYQNPLAAFQRTVGKEHHFRVNLLRHNAVFEEMMKDNLPYDEPFIEPGAMKIFADGAFGGSTAALSSPYADNPDTSGLLIHKDEELVRLVQQARAYGEAVAIHIIGDMAAEQVIGILEKYPVQPGKRDRLIHCSVLRPDLIERMKKLSVVLDLQPAFVPSDFPWVIDRLGPERLELSYACKSLINEGFMCAAGTDAPVEDINPIWTIYAAVERKYPGDQHDGYIPEEKITRFEAIQMYTVGSAQAICKEHERGLIKRGYVADFSIFDRDLFSGTTEDMLKAKAVKTVVDGRIVFERS